MVITIIGASFSGIQAALKARETYPEAQIHLVDKKTAAEIGYLPSGLQLYFNQVVDRLEEAYFTSSEDISALGITLILETTVTHIDTAAHQLTVTQNGQQAQLVYDKLLIATGSEQKSTQISGLNTDLIVRFKSLAQSKKGQETLMNSQHVAIIGGGQVGLEIADALSNQQKTVTLFESMDTLLLKYFDKDMLTPLVQSMTEAGVHLHFNESVTACVATDTGLTVQTTTGSYQQDAAVFSLSVFPRLDFLDETITCHQDQTILVDEYLQTTATDVFAIGDCIQIKHSLENESTHVPLINNAIRSAEVAVANLMGPTTPFVGSLRTIGTHLFGYYLASTGLTETEGVFFDSPIASQTVNLPLHLFKKEAFVTAKIVFNRDTQTLLGAQLIAKEPILEHINTLALAIQAGLTLADLRQKDYFFQPAYTPLMTVTNALGSLGKGGIAHDA